MKKLGLILLPLMVVSCLSDPEFGPAVNDTERYPLELFNEISQVPVTRVNDEGFCDGDGVGIFVVNYENNVAGTLETEGNQADNVRYVFDEGSAKWTPDKEVFFYDKTTHADIYGYYPYSSGISSITAYPYEVQQDQSKAAANGILGGYEASDFLWAKAPDIAPTSTRIPLTFSHIMAGAMVTLVEGTGFAAGEWSALSKSVLVTNTKREAQINLRTGTVTAKGEIPTTGIVTAKFNDDWRAVVVPQTVASGTPLAVITVDGVPYVFKSDADFTYLSGKLHKLTIQISKKKNGTVEFNVLSTSVTAWESDNVSHDGEAREYVVINVPERNHTTSALKAAIVAAGMDYTKIVNLKVTGQVAKPDFYFMRGEMTKLQSINMKEAAVDIGNGECAIPESAFAYKKTLAHFVFPDGITKIGGSAFRETILSGSLIMPSSIKVIGSQAFILVKSLSGKLILPKDLTTIDGMAFYNCNNLTGDLVIPDSVIEIYGMAFQGCSGFTSLQLPESLEVLGVEAFVWCSNMKGNLTIPNKLRTIQRGTFSQCRFDGQLHLHDNISTIDDNAFYGAKFRGILVLPEKILSIGSWAFYTNNFSGQLVLPKSLVSIGDYAFAYNQRLTGTVELPKELTTISANVFYGCSQLQGVVIPENIETIRGNAFANCTQLNSITCLANTPPTVDATAFTGVAKDNFTVEVPESSVSSYSTAPDWKEFKRFAAHRDFSISRNLFRALNAELTKAYILRAPSGEAWSIESKPDWVTVSPSSGTGKTEVSVTISAMASGSENRTGSVVFLLDGKDYRSTMTVEQYNYQYGDGDVITNKTKTVGNGVNLVFMADCFDAKDISEGKYKDAVDEAIGYFFAIEPYKTYENYFNVYTVFGLSPDSGIGSVNTIREAKFGSEYALGGICPDESVCYEYACKTPTVTQDKIGETLVILIENTSDYGGICYMWGDGSAIAVCPMSIDVYPYDFRGLVQHEAGGHGFGKLGDEYIYHNAFIQTCKCICCSHVKEFTNAKSCGWYDNLSLTGNMHDVPWSHLIFDPQYSNIVDIYEGGYMHTRGVFRSEPNSCMNNNVPYYSAISRESMVKRIMRYAGETYSFESFKANDVLDASNNAVISKSSITEIPLFMVPASHHEPVFMGDKPRIK